MWADLAKRVRIAATSVPSTLAFVIYTSGSIRQPEGVMVEPRDVARLFSAADAWVFGGPEELARLGALLDEDFTAG